MRNLTGKRVCELLYLPPYSPDTSTIGRAFFKPKRGYCVEPGPHPRGLAREAMGEELSTVTAQDTSHFFRRCGYHTTAQLP